MLYADTVVPSKCGRLTVRTVHNMTADNVGVEVLLQGKVRFGGNLGVGSTPVIRRGEPAARCLNLRLRVLVAIEASFVPSPTPLETWRPPRRSRQLSAASGE